MEKLYSLADAAEASGYNDQHLRKLCREQKVAHTIRGSRYFFTAGEMEALARHVEVSVQVAKIEKAEHQKEYRAVRDAGLLGSKRYRTKKRRANGEK